MSMDQSVIAPIPVSGNTGPITDEERRKWVYDERKRERGGGERKERENFLEENRRALIKHPVLSI